MGALPGTGSCADLSNPLLWDTRHQFEGGTWWTGSLDFSSTSAEFAALDSDGRITAVSGTAMHPFMCQCLEEGKWYQKCNVFSPYYTVLYFALILATCLDPPINASWTMNDWDGSPVPTIGNATSVR